MYDNDASGPAATDSLLAMLQTLRHAPGGAALLAEIESGRKVRSALAALVERAFVAFMKNAVDRYARTAPSDPTTRLKLKTIDRRFDALIEALGVRQPAPELRDAGALEQHLVALLWAVRQPAAPGSPRAARPDAADAELPPLQQALEAQLDKAIYANLDSIASLGSIEQTLQRVQPGELEEWREILRDAAREVIDDYRGLGENLQQARACFKQISRHGAAAHAGAGRSAALDREPLLQRLNAEMRRAQRYRHPLSLALLGPDHLEDIRHLVGAEAAREVLRYYLENVASCARAYDTVAGCKSHKLVWVLPGADTDQGVCALRKAQERITAAHYHYAGRLRPLPTFSAAVVGYSPGDDSAHLLARAETLVAFAERAGPNHIERERRRTAASSRTR